MRAALAAQIFSVEARKAMSYRTDFWINSVVVFAANLAIAYYLWHAIFAESGQSTIGGFTREGMILYYVLALLIGKVVSGNERELSAAQDIYQGSLTRYLLYPAGYFGFKYTEHLGSLVPALVQLVLFGGVASLLFDFSDLGAITVATVARTLVAVIVASLLMFLMNYAIQGVAFWADNVWSLQVMMRFITSLLGGLMLPLDLFPEWARQILELLPFQALFYFPVMTLLGRVGTVDWLQTLGLSVLWCAVIGAIGRIVWKRGYRIYTGVGI